MFVSTPSSEIESSGQFHFFQLAGRLDGLLVKGLLTDDAETLAAFETAMVGPAHRPKGGRSSDIVTTSERGNTKGYTLRRLSKDHTELFRIDADLVAVVARAAAGS
jgi:hypothetical protein